MTAIHTPPRRKNVSRDRGHCQVKRHGSGGQRGGMKIG